MVRILVVDDSPTVREALKLVFGGEPDMLVVGEAGTGEAAVELAKRLLPDVALGMGGFVSFPGGMMAVLSGIPLVVHEQNSVAGLANRVLARVADRVMTDFPSAMKKGE